MTPTSCVYVISDKTGAAIFVGKATGAESISALASLGALLPVTVREGLSEAEAFECERALIAFHGRADLGLGELLNFTDGGLCTPNPAAESRAASNAAKRRRVAIATAKHGAI